MTTGTLNRPRFILRSDLRSNPNALFVFGDNLARTGYGGQAREMRGEPNAVGVPTKYAPTLASSAYFTDSSLKEPRVRDDIDEAFALLSLALQNGRGVYIPLDGLGSGLADLPRRAPAVNAYIIARIDELHTLSLTPEPKTQYGLYHYRVACPSPGCSWSDESDKGMSGPEAAYQRHYLKEH